MTTVRYAPSPTGRLHLGNARPALINWLFAKANAGRYVLRLDDTDTARSTEEFARGIHDDLAWLGITPDLKVRQSDRTALYDAARDCWTVASRMNLSRSAVKACTIADCPNVARYCYRTSQ